MKKTSKLISILLALVMCLGCITPAFAADLTTAGGTSETPVVLNAAAATFSVTVPTALPIEVLADGTVVEPDAVKIINNSAGAVKVENVTVEGQNDWALVSFDTLPTAFKVDEKKIGLQINSANEKTAADGSFAFDATQWGVMTATDGAVGGSDEYEFTYDAILAPQSVAITDATVANVIFTIGWNKDADNLVKFIISLEEEEREYYATPTMTVAEWIDSDYNTDGYTAMEEFEVTDEITGEEGYIIYFTLDGDYESYTYSGNLSMNELPITSLNVRMRWCGGE